MLTGAGVATIALGDSLLTSSAGAVSKPDAQMKAVLDELAAFNAPPIEKHPHIRRTPTPNRSTER